jgi:hypothetical protein
MYKAGSGKISTRDPRFNKEKISRAKKFFKTVDDRKKKFTGPKSTKGSVGSAVNKFREMSDNMATGGRIKKMGGGMMQRNMYKAGSGKDTHVTKDGRTVKKGLYYYMNRAKKKGTSKPGKGSVTDKALKASAKTAKKPTKKA